MKYNIYIYISPIYIIALILINNDTDMGINIIDFELIFALT